VVTNGAVCAVRGNAAAVGKGRCGMNVAYYKRNNVMGDHHSSAKNHQALLRVCMACVIHVPMFRE